MVGSERHFPSSLLLQILTSVKPSGLVLGARTRLSPRRRREAPFGMSESSAYTPPEKRTRENAIPSQSPMGIRPAASISSGHHSGGRSTPRCLFPDPGGRKPQGSDGHHP